MNYLDQVIKEREQQDKKWGEQNHPLPLWATIIGEEYGEMCHEINEYGFTPKYEIIEKLKVETVQTMACCLALLESIDRNTVN